MRFQAQVVQKLFTESPSFQKCPASGVTDRLGGGLFRTWPIWENYDPHNKIGQKHHFWTQRMPPSSNLKFLGRNSTFFYFWFFILFWLNLMICSKWRKMLCVLCVYLYEICTVITFDSSNYCPTTVSLQDSTLIYLLYNVRCTVEIGVIPVKITNPVNCSWVKSRKWMKRIYRGISTWSKRASICRSVLWIVTLWNFLFFMTERCYKFKNVEFQM